LNAVRRQQRSCAKEISLINVVEDLAVDAVCRLRNFNAALPYQVERIARFAFTKNYFTGFLSQDAKFWRNALDDVGINSFEKPITAKSLDGSASRGRFHSTNINSRSMSRPADSYQFGRTSGCPERPDMVDNLIRCEWFSQKSCDASLHQPVESILSNKSSAQNN
jgi:hypothetical protein